MSWFRRSKSETPAEPSAEPRPPESAGAPANAKNQGATEPKRGGLGALFRQGLKRTSEVLRTDVRDLVIRKKGQLVDEWLDELYAILIRSDMGTGPANEIREHIQREFRGRVVEFPELQAAVKQKFRELLGENEGKIQRAANGPTVILGVGVNGSGKTTSIAKLANRFKNEGNRVVLGAGDTFRAGAIEQLTIWAERLGIEIVKGQPGGDPASVAHRAVARALETNADICIIDTAGRLQTQVNLMEQLKKIRRVISRQIPEAPHEVLLVLDATAGQNGLSQAQGFSEAAGCTGIVLAKLDGTAKGGVIIPICQRFKLPVKFIGVGESLDDLADFQVDAFVDGLF